MIVLDTSVILKWVLGPEAGHRKAVSYRQKHITGEELIGVPSLFFYETANVLSTRSGLPVDVALDIFRSLWDFDFEVLALDRKDFEEIIKVSRECSISGYDAVYIVIARKHGCCLVTADRKLFNRTRHLGFVELL